MDRVQRHTDYARKPGTWTNDARRHMAVAELLSRARNGPGRDFYETSGCFYASYFHAAVAVETAHKAVRIRLDPSLIQNGGLRQPPFGGIRHKLVVPVTEILGNVTPREKELLRKLEAFAEAGRYSVLNNVAPLLDDDLVNLLRSADIDEMGETRRLVERLCVLALEGENAA